MPEFGNLYNGVVVAVVDTVDEDEGLLVGRLGQAPAHLVSKLFRDLVVRG